MRKDESVRSNDAIELEEIFKEFLHPRGRGGRWIVTGGRGGNIGHIDMSPDGKSYTAYAKGYEAKGMPGDADLDLVRGIGTGHKNVGTFRSKDEALKAVASQHGYNDKDIRYGDVYDTPSMSTEHETKKLEKVWEKREMTPEEKARHELLTQARVQEAVAARKQARSSDDFVAARARERQLRARLQEAPAGPGEHRIEMVLDKLNAANANEPIEFGRGIPAVKLSDGGYAATLGGNTIQSSDPEQMAHAIAAYMQHMHRLKKMGEHALMGLSPDAAQSFTRTWSQRDGGSSQLYDQVYSQDPFGYVHDTFSQDMDPETRLAAMQALIAAKQDAGDGQEGAPPGGWTAAKPPGAEVQEAGTAQVDTEKAPSVKKAKAQAEAALKRAQKMAAGANKSSQEARMTLEEKLQDAIAARKAAVGTQEWVRAYAREKVFRRQLEEKQFTPLRRAKLAEKGHAMPGGRYPIESAQDLANAIRQFGRGAPADKPAIKAHIVKRAKALGLTSKLPEGWANGSSAQEAAWEELEEREVTTKERKKLEAKGHAMPGGRYPIRHAGDVAAAVKAFGRGNPPDKEAIRQHIIKRAKALGVHKTHIPDTWKSSSSS